MAVWSSTGTDLKRGWRIAATAIEWASLRSVFEVLPEPDGFGNSKIVQVKFAAEKPPAFEPDSVPAFHPL